MTVCYTLISKKVYESYKASKSRSQASRSTKAKVFIVVAVFFICFAPYHFARVPYTEMQTGAMVTSCWEMKALSIAKRTTLWLSATNVCLDPLIFVFLCRAFRKRLMAALCRRSVQGAAIECEMETSSQLKMPQLVRSSVQAELVTQSCQSADPSDTWKNSWSGMSICVLSPRNDIVRTLPKTPAQITTLLWSPSNLIVSFLMLCTLSFETLLSVLFGANGDRKRIFF